MSRFHLRFWTAIAVAVLLLGATVAADAADPAAFTYRGGERGTVVFDHHLHAAGGFVCRDCHTDYAGTGKQLFQTQKQGLIDRAIHDTDQSCFACHNGTLAFDKCDGCHRRL
jgi:c(7)-type cytochrome triheme protein